MEKNKKLIAQVSAENSRLKAPLDKKLEEKLALEKQLQFYPNDKMALKNAKSRFKNLEQKILITIKEKEDLQK